MTRPAKINRAPIPTTVTVVGTGTEGGDAVAPDPGDVLIWDGDSWEPGPMAGGNVPWWNVQTDGTCVGDGVTDDTVALQASIDDATANGTQSANIYFPPGTYLIGGALQDTGAFNGQILLPSVSTSDPQITVRLVGHARPPFAVAGPIPAPGGYSIIKSTLTGASGTAACISGGNQTFTSKNNIQVDIQNLLCTAPNNPSFTFINIRSTQGGSIKDLMITMTSWSSATLPTNSNAYGIKLPQRGQSNYTFVDGLCVYVFYTGAQLGELTIARGLIFGGDVRAVELTSSPHPALIVDMHQTGCGTGIKVTAGSFPVSCDVLQYNAEHMGSSSGALTTTTWDLDDGSNALNGHIRWMCASNAGPVDHVFTVNGGTGSSNAEMGPIVTGAPASADYLVGTANGSLSAEIVVGTTPGGELGGTWASPTVDTTHAGSTHIALSSATPIVESGSGSAGSGTQASKDDHVHPASASGGGVGPILIADIHSTPIVFADFLLTEAEDDLLYADA